MGEARGGEGRRKTAAKQQGGSNQCDGHTLAPPPHTHKYIHTPLARLLRKCGVPPYNVHRCFTQVQVCGLLPRLHGLQLHDGAGAAVDGGEELNGLRRVRGVRGGE